MGFNNDIVEVKATNKSFVRVNELKILELHEEELYYLYGANYVNAKKRYYNDVETLKKDYNMLKQLRDKRNSKPIVENDEENTHRNSK